MKTFGVYCHGDTVHAELLIRTSEHVSDEILFAEFDEDDYIASVDRLEDKTAKHAFYQPPGFQSGIIRITYPNHLVTYSASGIPQPKQNASHYKVTR